MPTMTPPESATIRLPATAWDVPPEQIRHLDEWKRVGTAGTLGALVLLGTGILTQSPDGWYVVGPGALLVAIALRHRPRHLDDRGATNFLRTTGAVRVEDDGEERPDWGLHVQAARIRIRLDEAAANRLKGVRWAVVDHTPNVHALIRVKDMQGALLYGQPDPREFGQVGPLR